MVEVRSEPPDSERHPIEAIANVERDTGPGRRPECSLWSHAKSMASFYICIRDIKRGKEDGVPLSGLPAVSFRYHTFQPTCFPNASRCRSGSRYWSKALPLEGVDPGNFSAAPTLCKAKLAITSAAWSPLQS